jgi:hypothetical protein
MKGKFNFLSIVIIFLFVLISFVSAADNSTNITQDIASRAINSAEDTIKEMQLNNFSVVYADDRLIEAKRVFDQARYAEILRGDINSSDALKSEARMALSIINWKNIYYSDVLFYTEDIQNRRETAFLISDRISIEQIKLVLVSNETKSIFNQARVAFYDERYNDSMRLLEDFKLAVEQEKVNASTLSAIKDGFANFFQKYWIHILIFLVLMAVVGYFFTRRMRKKELENKIKNMKAEKNAVVDLMKKTQVERFNENTISGLVYSIRMKKFEERMQEIKEELPVLENKLKRFKGKQGIIG